MDAAPAEPSRITILRAPGKRLTKTYARDRAGKVTKRNYDNPKFFETEVRGFQGIYELAELLRELQRCTDCCVIRAAPGRRFPLDGKPVQRRLYRQAELADARGNFHKHATKKADRERQDADVAAGRLWPVNVLDMFAEEPAADWLLLDFDTVSAPAGVEWRDDPAWTASYLRLKLPAEFHDAKCVFYATASAADPGKDDLGGSTIKMRLGFVLDRGVVFAEAKRWLAGTPIDPCTLRPIQVTYTAAPLFHDGLVDPLGERLGVLDGERELVAVPDIHVQQPEYDRAGHATYGPAQSAEGLGLLPSPRLDAALERLAGTGGATGSVRWALLQAAFDYAKDVGRNHVDVEALADAFAEAAAPYRSAAEIAGYGLEGLIGWALARVPPETADGTPPPGLPPYFDGGEQDPTEASATLRLTVANFVEQGLAYDGKGKPPRDAIAGGVGLGKTTITLQMLAQMAQGRTVHYYAPTLELGAEVVSKAQAHGLDAVLVRGREANKKDPARWPALCLKDDVASTLGGLGRNVWESLCRKEDDFGNVTTCEYFHGCAYVHQFDNLDGRLIVLAHEYLTLPKMLIAKPALVVVDERFHTTLIGKPSSLPLERVTAQRVPPKDGGHFRQLSADARRAVQAIESGKTMAEIGLTPERLREMARDEERMAEPPTIWPDMPYAEQRSRAQRLAEIEAFRLAKLWRVLAQDNDRVSQRVVIARGIEWKGERADRVFIHKAKALAIPKGLPVLLLDADHDPLIGAATLPTKRRTVIQPRLNAEVIQVWDTACSKTKLLDTATRRDQVLALARQEAAQGRRVLIGIYKPVADLLRAALDEQPNPSIDVAHFGAIRGLDGWKDFDTVIVAGREQLRPTDAENKARALFGADPEPLLLTGE